ncbi:uncharacterized protein LOC131051246 isoform X2 [Cryptomeria japonica]|uniref:uncharacterized protein LOC131051246 isoform X2 n=1 Tax=Cryptomeria japonica TaxID=3369 RepID=UPI0027D9D264|nr:uncharacterized protein LOC131051246 isoform X2 [Cryptomeria japonica]
MPFKLTITNLRIREALCCETTTVLTVTAIPGYAGKVNTPALRAHSTSLTTFENVQVSTQPFEQRHTKSTMDATMATETLLQDEMAGIAAAAAEAVALAKAAVKAARDVVALSEGKTLPARGYLKDFPSEADLLRLERARLTEMERSGIMKSLDNFKSENLLEDFKYQFPISSNSAYPLKRDCNLSEGNLTNSSSTCSLQKTSEITVKSIRKKERRTRRVGASNNAENAPAIIVPVKPARHRKSSSRFVWINNCSKLLTAKEEVELSQGVQDLMKLEKIRESYKEKNGREPTLSQWAKAAGIELKAFERRLQVGRYSKQKMVRSNLRLVISVAKKYRNRGVSLEDLVQEGIIGLVRGAEKFDSSMGFKFSTYAHWWIRQAFTKTLTNKSRTIRLPVHIHDLLSRIRKTRNLFSEQGRRPKNAEVAEAVGIPLKKMIAVLKSSRYPTSMDRYIGHEQDRTLSEIIANPVAVNLEAAVSQELLRKDLKKFLLNSLSEKERKLMEFRYGLDHGRMRTLQEIGQLFCVSRERARQIETNAMRKLKKGYRNIHLTHYLNKKEAKAKN